MVTRMAHPSKDYRFFSHNPYPNTNPSPSWRMDAAKFLLAAGAEVNVDLLCAASMSTFDPGEQHDDPSSDADILRELFRQRDLSAIINASAGNTAEGYWTPLRVAAVSARHEARFQTMLLLLEHGAILTFHECPSCMISHSSECSSGYPRFTLSPSQGVDNKRTLSRLQRATLRAYLQPETKPEPKH